jgi:hypothetical protein
MNTSGIVNGVEEIAGGIISIKDAVANSLELFSMLNGEIQRMGRDILKH